MFLLPVFTDVWWRRPQTDKEPMKTCKLLSFERVSRGLWHLFIWLDRWQMILYWKKSRIPFWIRVICETLYLVALDKLWGFGRLKHWIASFFFFQGRKVVFYIALLLSDYSCEDCEFQNGNSKYVGAFCISVKWYNCANPGKGSIEPLIPTQFFLNFPDNASKEI